MRIMILPSSGDAQYDHYFGIPESMSNEHAYDFAVVVIILNQMIGTSVISDMQW